MESDRDATVNDASSGAVTMHRSLAG